MGATAIGGLAGNADRIARIADRKIFGATDQDTATPASRAQDDAQLTPTVPAGDEYASTWDGSTPDVLLEGFPIPGRLISWYPTFPEKDLLAYADQLAPGSAATITIEYRTRDNEAVRFVPHAPRITLTKGNVAALFGAESYDDPNSKTTFYVLPGVDIGEAELKLEVQSNTGKKSETIPLPFPKGKELPRLAQGADDARFRVKTDTDVGLTLYDIADLGEVMNSCGSSLWRIFVTKKKVGQKLVVDAKKYAIKNILTVDRDMLPDTPLKPGLLYLAREAVNLIFTGSMYTLDMGNRRTNIDPLMQQLEDLFIEDKKKEGSPSSLHGDAYAAPGSVETLYVSSQQYGLQYGLLELDSYRVVRRNNLFDPLPYPNAREILREFLPLAMYMVPQLKKEFEKLDLSSQERLKQYMTLCLQITDTINPSEDVRGRLLPQRKELEELLQ